MLLTATGLAPGVAAVAVHVGLVLLEDITALATWRDPVRMRRTAGDCTCCFAHRPPPSSRASGGRHRLEPAPITEVSDLPSAARSRRRAPAQPPPPDQTTSAEPPPLGRSGPEPNRRRPNRCRPLPLPPPPHPASPNCTAATPATGAAAAPHQRAPLPPHRAGHCQRTANSPREHIRPSRSARVGGMRWAPGCRPTRPILTKPGGGRGRPRSRALHRGARRPRMNLKLLSGTGSTILDAAVEHLLRGASCRRSRRAWIKAGHGHPADPLCAGALSARHCVGTRRERSRRCYIDPRPRPSRC